MSKWNKARPENPRGWRSSGLVFWKTTTGAAWVPSHSCLSCTMNEVVGGIYWPIAHAISVREKALRAEERFTLLISFFSSTEKSTESHPRVFNENFHGQDMHNC